MSSAATNLCTSCGLCCSGAIFPRAVLRPEELEPARRRLALFDVREGPPPNFALPCSRFRNLQCDVYQERPAVCREFECKLLAKVQAGEVGFDEALVKVRRLQALHARVANLAHPESIEALLDLGELEALAGRDFRDPNPK